MTPSRSDGLSKWPGARTSALVVALAPAVVMAICSIRLNRFALIDDGITLLSARGSLLDAFAMPDHGRYFPFHVGFHWLLMSVFPPRPWVFSLANGAFVVLAAWQVQRFARTLAGPLAGMAAAWLLTLNLATVENMFTLSKAEPKQLVFWLATLALLGRALEGTEDRLTRFETPLMVASTTATVFLKETGGLLWIPLGLFAGVTWRTWKTLRPPARRRRLRLLAAAALPLTLSTAIATTYGLRRGSYARERIVGGSDWDLFPVSMPGHDVLLAFVLVAGIVGGLGLIVVRREARALTALLWLQLVVFVGFFAVVGRERAWMPYYYLPGVALAAVLLSAAALHPARRAPAVRAAAAALVLFAIVGGLGRSVAGAAVLVSWSSLHDRLTAAVVRERPPRAFFHRAGNWEVHVEAGVFWKILHGLPIVVGVLDADPEPDVPAVTRRELQPGDWIIEQFGTVSNAAIPFRDLDATRPLDHALVDRAGRTFLPVRLRERLLARFRLPPIGWSPFPSPRSFLEWQIYEVTAPPRLVFEGLDEDDWMERSARLWTRAGEPGPMTVRFTPFVASGAVPDHDLLIYAGPSLVARCPAKPQGVTRCTFDSPVSAGERDAGSWRVLELRATKTFSPRELGMSRDPRHFSFNFRPMRDAAVTRP